MQSQLAHGGRVRPPIFDLLDGRCTCPEFLVAFPAPVTGECIQWLTYLELAHMLELGFAESLGQLPDFT